VNPTPSWSLGVRHFITYWRAGGWVGSDLFFVLSGFLVSGLLFAEFKARGRISPLRFYVRRGWKIYPSYFVMLATTVALILSQGGRFAPIKLVAEVFFFQNYVPGLWNHTWSLAVEEHFYFLLPLVCLAVMRASGTRPAPLKPILYVGAGVAVCAFVLRVVNAVDHQAYSHYTHLYPTHLRLDSLFFGVMLSYAYHFHTQAFVRVLTPWRYALMAGGILLFVPAFILPLESSPLIYTVGFTVLYVASGMLMVGALLCDVQGSRMLGGLATIGSYSYSIYLWHMPVALLGIPMLERWIGAPFNPGTWMTLYLGGSIAFGVAMAKLVEMPTLRFRDRHFPAPSSEPLAAVLTHL
jgi:peptidoglycan/LPS O-acetylase OafA/YrhL